MFENGTGVTDMFAMNYIRKVGNEAMHGGDKEPFAGHSLAEVKQAAVMVYEYLFDMVNDIDMEFYLQENIIARRKAAQRQSSPASQKAGKPADKRGWGTWFK